MTDLPDYVEIGDSALQKLEFPDNPFKSFHSLKLGEHTLILKLEGSFYSYRDWVASKLFQKMRYNAQSSILLKMQRSVLSRCGLVDKDEYQQGIVFVEHHGLEPCGPTCDYNELVDAIRNRDLDQMTQTSFNDTEVIIMRSLLAHFFSANEASDLVRGKNHRLYLIDNSQMFSFLPKRSMILEWVDICPIGDKNVRRRILKETAKRISSLDQDWYDLCRIPTGYEVDELWDIKVNIAETIRIAKELASHT